MSAAELTAHRIYENYNLGALPNDVKDQVIILMLNSKSYDEMEASEEEEVCLKASEDVPPRMTIDELHARIAEAESDILNGRTYPIEDLDESLKSKYPWL